jgi:hypothetical protein
MQELYIAEKRGNSKPGEYGRDVAAIHSIFRIMAASPLPGRRDPRLRSIPAKLAQFQINVSGLAALRRQAAGMTFIRTRNALRNGRNLSPRID